MSEMFMLPAGDCLVRTLQEDVASAQLCAVLLQCDVLQPGTLASGGWVCVIW